MKTLLACLVFAAIGIALGLAVNERRYNHYEPVFGPISYRGEVNADNAMAKLQENWSEKQPKVELPGGHVYDFGVMSPEEKGEHIFIVKNVGEDTLKLLVGSSTCKCTVGELGNDSVEPGEQTEVKMSWTVKTNESTFGQSAELRTNDPSEVAIRLEIKGQVVRDIQLVPEEITFGEVTAGENIELDAKAFSYLDQRFKVVEAEFSDKTIEELADVTVTPFEPSAEDGIHEQAKQGFQVHASIRPGLRQGSVNQNITMTLIPEDATAEQADVAGSSERRMVTIPVTGRIVGALGMITSSHLRETRSGGGYLFDFGILEQDDSRTAKILVTLKGDEQKATELSVGKIEPAEYIEATLGKPLGKGKMTLYTLNLKLKPGEKSVERLGRGKQDYGSIMIQSDNPKVPALKLLLKFALPAR